MEPAQYQAYLKGVLRLSAQGVWHHNDTPFTNKRVSDLFFRSIVWDDARDEYLVRIGLGEATFDCEDTAYFVLQINENSTPWILTLSDGSHAPLDPNTLSTGSEHQLYCTVREKHRARFLNNCYQHLVQHCVSDSEIKVDGKIYSIATVNNE